MYGSGGNYQAYEKMGLDIAKKGIEVLQDSSPDKLERFSMIVGGAVGFCLGGKYGKLAGAYLGFQVAGPAGAAFGAKLGNLAGEAAGCYVGAQLGKYTAKACDWLASWF